jgi:hypothetical protein
MLSCCKSLNGDGLVGSVVLGKSLCICIFVNIHHLERQLKSSGFILLTRVCSTLVTTAAVGTYYTEIHGRPTCTSYLEVVRSVSGGLIFYHVIHKRSSTTA